MTRKALPEATMAHWMRRLAQHYEAMRRRFPDEPLTLVFDIDGTILDTRPALAELLKGYDAEHGTDYFATTAAAAGADWGSLVAEADVPRADHRRVTAELRRRWNVPHNTLAAHQPFQGMLEVIRWFQLQPGTHVALNTGRPESRRLDTLRTLNSLAREFRVSFNSELLFMRDDGEQDVLAAKRAGMTALRQRGYRVFAAVDNEAENLAAMAAACDGGELLTLQARTFHDSRRREGEVDLRELLNSRRLPRHVQFVWQDIAGEGELQRFLTSSIHWGEVTLNGFHHGTPMVGDGHLPLDRVLSAMIQRTRRCKLNVKHLGQFHALLPWLRRAGYPADCLWFDVPHGTVQAEILRRLAETLPGSIRQCPTDHLLQSTSRSGRDRALRALANAGATRFGIEWLSRGKATLLDQLDQLGLDAHLHGVPDLESFLRASLLLPRSIGTGFDFPQLTRQTAHQRRAG